MQRGDFPLHKLIVNPINELTDANSTAQSLLPTQREHLYPMFLVTLLCASAELRTRLLNLTSILTTSLSYSYQDLKVLPKRWY